MVTDARQARPVTPVSSVQSWERYREDAREAILAKLASGPGGKGSTLDLGKAATAAQPTGLVRATVLQANSDSEALVDIGGKSYLINTKQALASGANVILRLLDARDFANSAAQGFKLRPGSTAQSGSVEGSQNAEQPGAIRKVGVAPTTLPALAELNTESSEVNVRLSGSARLLSALAGQPNALQRLVPLTPLALGSQVSTADSAQRIQHAVEHSGLFYESHLQEWQEGRRSLESLRAEPQAALSPGPPAKEVPVQPPQMETEAPSTPEQNAAKGLQAALGAIPADVRPLVQDQIALLETGRMALLGTWEDRQFTLEIEPDDNSTAKGGDIPLSWRVRIQLDAPNLGKLDLEVALTGTQTQVTVRPDTRVTRGQALRDVQAALTSASMELQQSLDARGLQMTGLNITTTSKAVVSTAAQP